MAPTFAASPTDRRLTGPVDRIIAGEERFVVVGAGGWLGLATLELLSQLLGEDFERRVVALGSNDRQLRLRDGLTVSQLALDKIAALPPKPTVVLHLAFLTKDRAETMPADQYISANRRISRCVLESLDGIGAAALFVPSSGAAYSAGDSAATEATKLYGQMKLDDENMLRSWAASRGARAVIARVFNLSGPYINKLSSYALAAFLLDCLARRPIQIRADRPVFRSYVAIRELMSVVLGLLLDGSDGTATFDTAGARAYELADIADAARAALHQPELPICRPTLRNGAPDVYVGDATLYAGFRQRLGVECVDFPTQVLETAAYLQSIASEGPERPLVGDPIQTQQVESGAPFPQ